MKGQDIIYTYNNPQEGKSKENKTSGYTHTSTTTRQSDGFTVHDKYDREEYLIETKQQSQNNIIKNTYEYRRFTEGNKKITKETVQEYNNLSPNQYIERITTKDYNDYQQPILEKQGNLEVSYEYDRSSNGYSLMKAKTIKRNATNQTRAEYMLSSDGKTVQTENIYDIIIANGQKL